MSFMSPLPHSLLFQHPGDSLHSQQKDGRLVGLSDQRQTSRELRRGRTIGSPPSSAHSKLDLRLPALPRTLTYLLVWS